MERQSASAYFTWDITWTLCNACNPTFYWPVRCTPNSCRVCPMPWAHATEKAPFLNWLQKFFLKGVVFLFWHDIVYIDLLYYVTNFELVCTWNKVAVIENAKSVDCTPPFTTSLTQRNVLKATVPDRMVWLPKPACVIVAVRLSKALKDAHSKESSNLHVRAVRF